MDTVVVGGFGQRQSNGDGGRGRLWAEKEAESGARVGKHETEMTLCEDLAIGCEFVEVCGGV